MPRRPRCSRDSNRPTDELEARERWGDSAAHSESAARTAGYGEREWREIAAESGQINADFAAAMAAGEPAGASERRRSRNATASTSRAGSIRARPSSTVDWASSTSLTRASPPTSKATTRPRRLRGRRYRGGRKRVRTATRGLTHVGRGGPPSRSRLICATAPRLTGSSAAAPQTATTSKGVTCEGSGSSGPGRSDRRAPVPPVGRRRSRGVSGGGR